MFSKLDRTVFWKFGYWLARKYRRGFRSLMREHVRAPEPGQAKTWVLQGQNSRGWYGATGASASRHQPQGSIQVADSGGKSVPHAR